MTEPDDLPLAGITVVAVEQAVAAPLATRHLADLGARVIKIERPGEGDFARAYDATVHGQASHFIWLNRGKESIELDLGSDRGREVALALAERADVVISNLAPGAMDRLGLGATALRARKHDLVVVTISGYGDAGPYTHRKAYDMLVQAESGLCSVTGTPETATKTGVPVSDIATGMYALSSIEAALFRRERTGRGATIEVSMFEATAEWMGHPMYIRMYADRQVGRMGLSHASICPYDAFPTRDGQVLIGVQNDRGWAALVRDVLGRPDLVDDERYATNIDRVARRAEVDALIGSLTRGFDTVELADLLDGAGVPAARLNDVAGLVDHPQLDARDRWRDVQTPGGPVRGLLPPMTFTDVELPMGAVPALGEHTDTILAELGLRAPTPDGTNDSTREDTHHGIA
ncbi:crotonobetainyl-CoA:carnitine CoA-transferase CaiB-like acyl-CoA transferase [Dietzia kunjamensis]|uniref:CaiB/BaiF CoA transferase family protein n=1 Tax=Dietzia kunjamensis TaxID=322509 RepID=UPI000E7373AA|nr:CaiB/BaiF CoA-transferase family protein [Dietzia kunjamensis]MBB1011492.1 CoA transferase [Dietzia kunjamensis]RKE66831.1 crotonobetainyl-CoA:carnitine CoA-transferase CaiB-like acyl-CoA transferase [Dietzia kunjamensis]